jgi:protein TonB
VRAIFLAAFICLAFLSLQPRGNGQGNSARPKPTPQPTPSKPKTIVSGGVLNGKAISKPQPAYPPIAKAAKASGTVTVQVLVSEEGNVISARAVSGHPLLRQAAVDAAYRAKFSPVIVSGQKVKMSGALTYNFVFER